jgi:transposase-like protein
VEDILIAAVDGLKGFPEAITTVFPQAQVQTCIVHLTRYSLSFCSWKERKAVAQGAAKYLPGRKRDDGKAEARGVRAK